MISNELLEEVINVSKKGRYISRGLLFRIAINVIENLPYETKSKFQEFKFAPSDWEFAIATCDRRRGIIEVDYCQLLDQVKKLYPLDYLGANLAMIQYVLHETQHLDEIFKSMQNNLQAKIIKISAGEFIHGTFMNKANSLPLNRRIEYANKKFQEFNENFWRIIPVEKIAEADSYRNLLGSLDLYPNFITEYNKTYLMVLISYLKALKLGYDEESYKQTGKYNIPLIDYLEALGCERKLEKFELILKPEGDVSRKMSIEDRMKFGFPITKEDIKELNKQKIILKRR